MPIPAATAAGFRDLRAVGICTGVQIPALRREAARWGDRKPIPAATAAGFRDLRAVGICTGVQIPALRQEAA
jgi:hypothetical protein